MRHIQPPMGVVACHMGAGLNSGCSTSNPIRLTRLGKQERTAQVLGPLHHVGDLHEGAKQPSAAVTSVTQDQPGSDHGRHSLEGRGLCCPQKELPEKEPPLCPGGHAGSAPTAAQAHG